MNIDEIQFQKSSVIEKLLIDWGSALCDAVIASDNKEDLIAIRSAITEFSILASAYSEAISGFQEDLGVSLGEAASLKQAAIEKNVESNEWQYYLAETQSKLLSLGRTH